MRILKRFLCLPLIFSISALGATFPKGIKYLGGPGFPDKKDIRNSWDNSLTVTDKEITLGFRKNLIPEEVIPVSSIGGITYGQATTRRVGKWIAVGVIVAPIALVGIFHKSRQHRILVEWTDDQQRERGMLIQAHKDHFVNILNDLAFHTGKPIKANSEDREWLFRNGVMAELDEDEQDRDQSKNK